MLFTNILIFFSEPIDLSSSDFNLKRSFETCVIKFCCSKFKSTKYLVGKMCFLFKVLKKTFIFNFFFSELFSFFRSFFFGIALIPRTIILLEELHLDLILFSIIIAFFPACLPFKIKIILPILKLFL